MVGYVQGIIMPQALGFKGIAHWENLYPGWENKPIVVVQFKKPQRSISMEEFIAQSKVQDGIDPTDLDILYQNSIPVIKYAYYPIDDLELC